MEKGQGVRIKIVALACGWAAVSLVGALSMACGAQAQTVDGQTAGNAQSTPADQTKPAPGLDKVDEESVQTSSFTELGKDFLRDQEQIWTSPSRIRFSDTEWLVPFSGIAAGLFVTDDDVSRHLSHAPSTLSHYNTLSNAGIGALVGGAAGMWLLSYPSHNSHWRETGLLAGEAALNSLVPIEVSKYALGRQRPLEGNGGGGFFQSGTSFPSEHAAAAWAVAGVIGHEYPGPLPKLFAYGLASMVSYSRIRAAQHFPSDVFVGSILGSLIAQQIYSRHHDPELGASDWRSMGEILRAGRSSPGNQGSPYVPLDSWIYPALDRLAGFGVVDSAFAGDAALDTPGMRPVGQ